MKKQLNLLVETLYICFDIDGCKKRLKFSILNGNNFFYSFSNRLKVLSNLPSPARSWFYNTGDTRVSCFIPLIALEEDVLEFLRKCVCMSTVLALCPENETDETEEVVLFLFEFNKEQTMIIGDGRKGKLSEIQSYKPSEKCVVIDFRALLLFGAYGDFEIAGKMTSNGDFKYCVLINPMCNKFLCHLFEAGAEIFVITSEDLTCAREAVMHANVCNWVSSKNPMMDSHQVFIPPQNVFSTRYGPNLGDVAPNTLDRIFFDSAKPANIFIFGLAEDWNSNPEHVVETHPFQPGNPSNNLVDAINFLTTATAASPVNMGAAASAAIAPTRCSVPPKSRSFTLSTLP